MNSSVVLLSSGLDSTVNLFMAHHSGKVELALTFNYGQRAAEKEIEKSRQLCHYLNIPHKVIDVTWITELGKSALIDQSKAIPQGEQVQIDSIEQSSVTAKSVWVPNRNGIFLNIAAGYAESLLADSIVPGFNKEEAVTFPDNSSDFILAVNKSLNFSTSNQVKVHCYTIKMNKTEIVKKGLDHKVPFHLMWPCYQNLEHWCGECESCQRAYRAFQTNGIKTEEFFLK